MKRVLFSFLLSILFLSCGNNFISPSSYSKDQIDKKYPYWKVGVSNFWVDGDNDYTELTVSEKRFYLSSLALIRLIVNSEEFNYVFQKNADKFVADLTVSKEEGAIYPVVKGDKLNVDRLIKVIRVVSYDVEYGKGSHKNYQAFSDEGNYHYSFYGSSIELLTGKRIWFPNYYLIDWAYNNLYYFSALVFHEHLHNIGFTHNSATIYAMQDMIQNLGYRILEGDLKDKYEISLDELTAYYFTEYKRFLLSSTVYHSKK